MSDELVKAIARDIREVSCADIGHFDSEDMARAAIAAIEASGTHCIAPLEPTIQMREAFVWADEKHYQAMLAVRPKIGETDG